MLVPEPEETAIVATGAGVEEGSVLPEIQD
jgi:hypothetical protein